MSGQDDVGDHGKPPPIVPVAARRRLSTASSAPTLAQVARQARVSTATVSRTFNHPEDVRPEVSARVLAVAGTLGYVPRAAARILAGRRSRLAGLIVPSLDDPLTTRLVSSLQRGLEDAGYALLLATSGDDPDRELVQARALLSRGVEALALAGTVGHSALATLMAAQGIPLLRVGTLESGRACVGFDHHLAGSRLAQHLLELGHVRIAVLLGAADPGASDRYAGMAGVLAQRGLAFTAMRRLAEPFDYAAVRTLAREILELPQPPTALVGADDRIAFGVLRECLAAGVSIPAQLSVAGCGDLDLAAQMVPALTTLRLPMAELGREAAAGMLRLLAGEPLPAPIELPVKLVVRGSTGRVSTG